MDRMSTIRSYGITCQARELSEADGGNTNPERGIGRPIPHSLMPRTPDTPANGLMVIIPTRTSRRFLFPASEKTPTFAPRVGLDTKARRSTPGLRTPPHMNTSDRHFCDARIGLVGGSIKVADQLAPLPECVYPCLMHRPDCTLSDTYDT